ncbi:hypothetical protein H4CHR_02928 [Variovorax sp. PBS-H4]|uniref:hypothetical protein n=1 Tax=Variovorax sp. PBS-H4 TaxID=434008 RepID=UPI00131669D6|nr:hypothetical protein [Variovorax sp. PBS-H4]VTU32031.1 hypothetical protein H4CHR_02928 [Variovorax sp. PBS-H4]
MSSSRSSLPIYAALALAGQVYGAPAAMRAATGRRPSNFHTQEEEVAKAYQSMEIRAWNHDVDRKKAEKRRAANTRAAATREEVVIEDARRARRHAKR